MQNGSLLTLRSMNIPSKLNGKILPPFLQLLLCCVVEWASLFLCSHTQASWKGRRTGYSCLICPYVSKWARGQRGLEYGKNLSSTSPISSCWPGSVLASHTAGHKLLKKKGWTPQSKARAGEKLQFSESQFFSRAAPEVLQLCAAPYPRQTVHFKSSPRWRKPQWKE